MKRCIALFLIAVMLIFACALAEDDGLEAMIPGCWNVDRINSDGVMMTPAAYGLTITLTFKEDGSAEFDYAGEIEGGMSWYVKDGKLFLKGYVPEEDVEVIVGDNSLQISDSIGDMYLSKKP